MVKMVETTEDIETQFVQLCAAPLFRGKNELLALDAKGGVWLFDAGADDDMGAWRPIHTRQIVWKPEDEI